MAAPCTIDLDAFVAICERRRTRTLVLLCLAYAAPVVLGVVLGVMSGDGKPLFWQVPHGLLGALIGASVFMASGSAEHHVADYAPLVAQGLMLGGRGWALASGPDALVVDDGRRRARIPIAAIQEARVMRDGSLVGLNGIQDTLELRLPGGVIRVPESSAGFQSVVDELEAPTVLVR